MGNKILEERIKMKEKRLFLNPVMNSWFLLILSCLFLTSCKDDKPFRSITYDAMQQGLLDQSLTMDATMTYLDAAGNTIDKATIKPDSYNPMTSAWFVNSDNRIVQMQLLDAAAALQLIKNDTLIKDVKALNCDNLKSILNRIYTRDMEPNPDTAINDVLEKQNATAILAILETCGMPTMETASDNGMQAVWSVLQKVPVEKRSAYFKDIVTAAQNGDLSRQDVALMQDRMLMDYGEPQLYGSQITMDATGNPSLYPLKKPERVDARRAIMGLPPLQEYLMHFNIPFNVPQETVKTESK